MDGVGAAAFAFLGRTPDVALFFLLVLAGGVAALLSPLLGVHRARTTLYALTNKRCLIIRRVEWGKRIETQSFDGEQLGQLPCVMYADGSGDVVLNELVVPGHRMSPLTVRVGFIGVGDVKRVEGLIREALLTEAKSQS